MHNVHNSVEFTVKCLKYVVLGYVVDVLCFVGLHTSVLLLPFHLEDIRLQMRFNNFPEVFNCYKI